MKKGSHITEKHKEAIRNALKGKQMTKEFGERISKRCKGKTIEELYGKEKAKEVREKWKQNKIMPKGETHYNWKGGVTPFNRKLRTSSMWKIWRELVFLRDNFTCQNPNCEFCHNKIGVMLHPHHKKPISLYPELAFNVGNGITYCKEYHINSKLLHKNIIKSQSIKRQSVEDFKPLQM